MEVSSVKEEVSLGKLVKFPPLYRALNVSWKPYISSTPFIDLYMIFDSKGVVITAQLRGEPF